MGNELLREALLALCLWRSLCRGFQAQGWVRRYRVGVFAQRVFWGVANIGYMPSAVKQMPILEAGAQHNLKQPCTISRHCSKRPVDLSASTPMPLCACPLIFHVMGFHIMAGSFIPICMTGTTSQSSFKKGQLGIRAVKKVAYQICLNVLRVG